MRQAGVRVESTGPIQKQEAYLVVNTPIDGLSCNRNPAFAEKLFQKVPITQFLLEAAAVVEGVETNVVLVISGKDLRHQKAIRKVPAGFPQRQIVLEYGRIP